MRGEILDALLDARAAKRGAVLATDTKSGEQRFLSGQTSLGDLPLTDKLQAALDEAVRADKGRVVEDGGRLIFVQVYAAPLRLVVVGAVHIAQALVPMAQIAGYDVTVVDPRRAFASDERFPAVTVVSDWPDDALQALGLDARTAVVTLTHDPKLDDPALDVALRSEAFYIAALGSRRTHATRRERLAALGHGEDAFARIHGPAGLSIGAVSPAEIAISVLAQMTAVLRGA